ncbi:MAG: hydroxymethylglutaryl-CoA lyase, partial [Candidatus Methylomirabilales bacterium]
VSGGEGGVSLPASVTVVEVGPRDGLQNLTQVLSTADKVRYIGLLAASGLTAIEVTSFVSPKAVPQLADAAETVAGIRDLPITPIALIPGITEVTLADTVGFGNPELVRQILLACRERFPGLTYGVHFHDTRGLGIANALMAMQCGVTVLDAAAGGLGGCPFAPGATGNIATEDLVFLCEEMGIKTGVDLARLCEASRFLQSTLPGVSLPSRVFQTGPPKPRGPISG